MTQPDSALNSCPLCQLAAYLYREENADYVIHCERCGGFVISDAARVMLETLPLFYLIALTRASHVAAAKGETMHITIQNVAVLVAPYL